MSQNDPRRPLVVILGPTAVGKTEVALILAEHFDGEIVSADSRLFYLGMDIGTAKPSKEERARVPHHLIDVTTPDRPWSLAQFQECANKTIVSIQNRGRLPFLVGGTGQYINAVIENWLIPAQVPDIELRKKLEEWGKEIGAETLHQKLNLLDLDASLKIDPKNLRRTVRALEVIFHTGKKFSAQRSKGSAAYRVYKIGLTRPRSELYKRIDARIDRMIINGLKEEVRNLLDSGYPPDLPPFSAIGYREMIQVLQGKITIDEAISLMKRASRQFVRRQANWFKLMDPSIRWFDLSVSSIGNIEEYIRSCVWMHE